MDTESAYSLVAPEKSLSKIITCSSMTQSKSSMVVVHPSTTTACASSDGWDRSNFVSASAPQPPVASKTVPFYPRVLLSVSNVGAQTPALQGASSTVLSDPCQTVLSQHHLANLQIPSTSASSSGSQFFPLIFAATPTCSSNPISTTAHTSLHLQVGSFPTPGACNALTSPVSNCSVAVRSSSNDTTVASSTGSNSLIASMVNRSSAPSANNMTSVVISPQSANPMQPAFTLRFTSPATIQCSNAAVKPVSSSACSLLFEAPVLSSQLSANSQRPVTLTTSSSSVSSSGSTTSNSLLVSSAPRVLIHKPTLVPHSGQISGASVDQHPLTFVATPNRGMNIDAPSTSSSAIISSSGVHEQSASHQPLTPSKTKLFSLASSVPSNVRLLATPSAGPHLNKCASTPASGTLQPLLNTTLQTLTSPIKASLAAPATVWSGIPGSHGSPPTNFVALQSSQSLLVQAASEPAGFPSSASLSTSVSLNPISNLRNLAAVPTTSTGASVLSGSAPTVLAFSLTTTTATSSTAPCNAVLTHTTSPIRQAAQSNTPALIIRAGCTSAVTFSTNGPPASSLAPVAAASLLKPLNIPLGSVTSASQPFLTSLPPPGSTITSLPHIAPVSIAPAKIPGAQPSTITPTSGLSTKPHAVSTFPSHRHGGTSILSQPSRKRSRKQQLASSSTGAMTSSAPATTSGTVAVSVVQSAPGLPATQLASPTGRGNSLQTPTIVAISKSPIQPYQAAQVSHAPVGQSPTISPKPGGGPVDHVLKSACSVSVSGLNTASCTSTPLNVTTGGLVGIRLLSVRANPTPVVPHSTPLPSMTSFQSNQPAPLTRLGVTSGVDSSPLVVVTPSTTVSSGSAQLRIATPHPLPSAELQSNQAATVYVLTSSAYPVLSTGGGPSALPANPNSSSNNLTVEQHSTSVPPTSYATALMVPAGPTGNVLQVRFRPPLSNTTLTTSTSSQSLTPFLLDAQTTHSGGHVIPPTPSTGQQNALGSLTKFGLLESACKSESTAAEGTESPSKNAPLRTSLSSNTNSLLHRHLLSPQSSVLSEPFSDHFKVQKHAEDSENLPASISGDHPPTGMDYVSIPSRRMSENREDFHTVGNRHSEGKHKLSGYHTENKFIRGGTAAEEVLRYEDSDAEDSALVKPFKRSRLNEALKQDITKSNDEDSIPKSKYKGNKGWSSNVLVGVNPSDGCEWVISGLPPKISIIPKSSLASGRTGSAWRAKSNHFLSPSEVRCKADSKLDPMMDFCPSSSKLSSGETSEGTAPHSSRRRRHSLTPQTSLESSVSVSLDTSVVKPLKNGIQLTAVQRRLLHDLVNVRLQQLELRFIRFPLTDCSVLNLTGWRALTCANNLDLLAYSEHQGMQSLGSIDLSLRDWFNNGSPPSRNSSVCLPFLGSVQDRSEGAVRITSDRTCVSIPQTPSESFVPENTAGVVYDLEGFDSLERISTATVLSSLSSFTRRTAPIDPDLTDQLEKALDLIRGVSQRKQYLLESAQRLHFLTTNIVEHFRPDAFRLMNELENQISTSPPSPSRSPVTVNSVTARSTRVPVRRSVRHYSPVATKLKRIRARDLGNAESNVDLVPNSPKFLPKSDAPSCTKSVLCNGIVSNSHGSHR
ncbi:unnamed protein product [Calicophoron daubneyi]|uniref:Uncharacterized protein n=1 Tax=Calicophoron daubneyi TaxID=300641 RepID=A0AAV2TX89_CALDB